VRVPANAWLLKRGIKVPV